jgi:hypothetical protein
MNEHTPTPWMTHRAGEMLPDDWMIVADMGLTPNGIQQVSTVARALSIRQTPETTAANAAFIVKAVNNHEALVQALKTARARIEYLGAACNDPRHFQNNADVVLPNIDRVLDLVGSPRGQT